MTMKSKAAIPLLAAMTLGLTACEEGQFLASAPASSEETTVRPPAKARVEIQEVERRDIFATTELALWDGRPSLGGIWIAHPDVTDPERVLIRNATSGKSIYGALFRRERDNPGPRLQLSSDAAAELGIIAGQPTELSVIVVRREEVTIEPVPVPLDETAAPENSTPSNASAAAVPLDANVTEPAAAPKRQGFFARLFGGGAAAGSAAAAEDADAAAPPTVETETLDPITTGAAAAIAAAETSSAATTSAAVRPVQRAALPAVAAVAAPTPTATPAPTVVATPTPTPAALNNPYVQVGLFTVEANANAAATGLRQGGIVPTITPGTNASGTFWRVLVGPMTDAADQSEILAQVKSLGYSDAFLVSN